MSPQGGQPTGVEAAKADILAAVQRFHREHGDAEWLGVAELRDLLGEKHNRRDVDEAVRQLVIGQDSPMRGIPAANRQALTDRDREAAVPVVAAGAGGDLADVINAVKLKAVEPPANETTQAVARGQDRAASAARRLAKLSTSDDPKDNGAKIRAALDSSVRVPIDLYRTINAGPSGQRARKLIARFWYNPEGDHEFNIVDMSVGEKVGEARIEGAGDPPLWSFTDVSPFDGTRKWMGYGVSLAAGADEMINGTFAVSHGNSDTRRLGGGARLSKTKPPGY